MLTPSARLRRAFHLRSETLVRRIILSNPDQAQLVRSADLDNNAKTSLHLCAQLGLPQIAEFLLDQGHEDEGISRTLDGQTAMMIAAAAGGNEDDEVALGRVQVGQLLIERFPDAVAIRDKQGMDVFSHATKHGTDALLIVMLSNPPPASMLLDPTVTTFATHPLLGVQDNALNTPLHHASAFGHLKTLRLLISAGADHGARNAYKWTPVDYSATVAAEVYLRSLVKEREQLLLQRQQRRESPSGGISRSPMAMARLRGGSDEKGRAQRGGAVRLVRSDTSGTEEEQEQVATVIRRARAQT